MATRLEGVGVLVTRPAHQSDALCALIEREGGRAVRFPVLDIAPLEDTAPLLALSERLEDYDWAIFISANAVDQALSPILAQRAWPRSVRIAVIGKRSEQALQAHGLAAAAAPEQGFNSEALLALAPMQEVAGQRIVIFRGQGGREFLADTLMARGAHVDYAQVYRRVRPDTDPAELLDAWANGKIQIVTANSGESLRNLYDMVGERGRALLLATPLLVVSDRVLPLVEQLGFSGPPVLADNATDAAVVDALLAWRRAQQNLSLN